MNADEIIAQGAERWNACDGTEEATLIRLAILRDILAELHARKSSLLARGQKEEARGFKEWETRLEELRDASKLEGSLGQLLLPSHAVRKRTRLLPEALFSFLARDKFERYDRTWESAMAAEAVTLGWCFWSLDAWVEIAAVETWQRALETQLMPHGVLLFAESAAGGADAEGPPGHWHGRWIVVLKARFKTPDFRVGQIPGTSPAPSPPRWKLLFSPVRR